MKKILKITLSVALAFVCLFSFTACKKKISATTVDTSKVAASNGESTNGGISVVHDGYLYFINGMKTNDGTGLSGNKKSAICRVEYNNGTIDEDTYEIVVDDLVGFEDGSLYVFGDFLYYTTPCSDKNNKATVLYNKTSFMRYDLVNEKSYEIFTTAQNVADEAITYAYYVVGDKLNLVVYEKKNATITSLNINKKVTTNYVISGVESCVLGENNGIKVTTDSEKDANNFVFYTTGHSSVEEDKIQTGNKVYRTSPVTNDSSLICDNGSSISILMVRNGKLVYACDTRLYAELITGAKNETLKLDTANVIAHNYSTEASYLFIENEDGSISVLYYDSTAYNLNIITWKNSVLEPVTIQEFTKDDKFEFITTTTLTETEEAEGDEPAETHDVTYLIYINNKKLYKIEIALDGKYSDSVFAEPIQLTTTEVTSATGLLVPEVVDDYVYIFALDSNKSTYLHRTDVTIDVNVSELEEDDDKKAKFVGIKDKADAEKDAEAAKKEEEKKKEEDKK